MTGASEREKAADFENWADCFFRAMNLRIGYLKSIGEWDMRKRNYEDFTRPGNSVWDVAEAIYDNRRKRK